MKAGRFLEHGEYDGNLYGTKIESIHEVVAAGRTCILDVNPQVRGGEQVQTGVELGSARRLTRRILPPGSEGSENGRIHAVRGVHRGAGFRHPEGDAQGRGGRWDHHEAADGTWVTPPPPLTFRTGSGGMVDVLVVPEQDVDLRKTVDESARIQRAYGHYFDLTVVNDNLDKAFETLQVAVDGLCTDPQWVPVNWVY